MASLTVISSTLLPPGVRGSLTKWLTEIGPGVFVGKVSTRVRLLLWQDIEEAVAFTTGAHATIVFPSGIEQGFVFNTTGPGRYQRVTFDGLVLVDRQPAIRWEEENNF